MTPEIADEQLMLRVGRGDVFAYTTLVQRHLPAVYRRAYRLLHDRHEAEDVAQESFARLWRRAPQWTSSGAGVPAWLHRVCMNLCLDLLRKKARWTVADLPELSDPAVSADRLIEQGEMQDILEDCLQALAGKQRAAIVLTYYEGYSNKQAAEALSLDIKAFESLLHRARRKLLGLLSLGGIAPHDLELLA